MKKEKTVRELLEWFHCKRWFVFVDGKRVNKDDFLDEIPHNYFINDDKDGYIYFVTE